MKILLFSLLLVSVADTLRISQEMNEMVQERCGRRAYQQKVLNGEAAKLGEFPWAATLYIKRDNGRMFLGPATIISNRHMLAYNIIRKNDTGYFLMTELQIPGTTCEGDHLILPDEILPKFDVDFEYLSPVRTEREFHETVSRITIVDGCKSAGSTNLFIVELKEDLKFNKYRRPACVSNSPKNWNAVERFPMYGINATGILASAEFSPVECDVEEPLACAKAVNSNQGLCAGDFGGSATPYLDNKGTVIGVFVKGNINCAVDPATVQNYKFINLGYLRQKICDVTGVCAAPPPEELVSVIPEGVTDAPIPTTDNEVLGEISGGETNVTQTTVQASEESEESTDQDPFTPFTDVYHPPTESPTEGVNSTERVVAETYPPLKLNSTETILVENGPRTVLDRENGTEHETIVAETYPRMALGPKVEEVGAIVAETFDKLKLNGTIVEAQIITEIVMEKLMEQLKGCSFEQEGQRQSGSNKEVHIHLHLDN